MAKRPSGAGSNSRRFATLARPDGTKVKVPVIKNAGTAIYEAEPDGSWPNDPTVVVLEDVDWLEEGAAFDLEETAAGKGMGTLRRMRVVEVRKTIGADSSGKFHKYGQTKRLVLVAPTEDYAEAMKEER